MRSSVSKCAQCVLALALVAWPWLSSAASLEADTSASRLVVRASKTMRDELRRSARMIRDVGGSIVGVIVNELDARDSYYGYGGYGYGGYGYGRTYGPDPDPDAKPDKAA